MSRRDEYRTALRALTLDLVPAYLTEHSGLPGPRGNLALLDAFGDVGDADLVRLLATNPDEYLRCCGIVGLGRLLTDAADDATSGLVKLLHAHACDESWRAREAVAIALQRVGEERAELLRTVVRDWAQDDGLLVRRAAIAAICEPRLLTDPATATAALSVCEAATAGLTTVPLAERRRADVRTLRQALGYCWSVAIAATPVAGLMALAELRQATDPDVQWVVRENLRKARLQRVLARPS